MAAPLNRRLFLRTALSGLAAVSASPWLVHSAFAKSSRPLSATPLSGDLVMISGAGGNVVAARDAQGVLMVDGGLRERSGDLLKLVRRELSAKRIHTLFNTHWHPEQTGSNERLGKEGAKIISHENTRLWLRTAAPLPSRESETYGPLPPKACPTDTIYTQARMPFGSGAIDYGYLLQAHTDGDIYVFFRDANVLVAGGPVSGEGWPVLDWGTGGWMGGLVNGLKTLASLADDGTRVVPANGPVLTRADLVAQHEMYSTIFGRLQKALRSGLSPAEAVAAAPAREYETKWGPSEQFVATAFKSLWAVMTPDA
jgi:cyclase